MRFFGWEFSGDTIPGQVVSGVLGAVLGSIATSAGAYALTTSEVFAGWIIHKLGAATPEEVRVIDTQVIALQTELAKMESASGTGAVLATDSKFAGNGSVVGYSGTANLGSVSCPPGSFVSAIQGFTLNGQNTLEGIRYACRPLK